MWHPTGDIVLISDPRVAAIPLEDSGEPLVDVRGRLRVDERMADPGGAYAHLRQGVVDRLERAERTLPDGYHLLIVEGHRTIASQRQIFDGYRAELAERFPGLTPDELRSATSRYVSPVEVAPHTAGAAVDLTLCDPDGAEYDMGTAINDTPERSGGLCYTAAPDLPETARRHRKILAGALEPVGLVNYATEWWHWSYGDRYWAFTVGAPHALYGPASL
ncbi:M15 family metallopeptidase [Nonomuraea rhodomycinica]|uniref:M15 family metallopeptidase n=1 Tax=Nonomuraea rhodomycinica TaxID=1712872 RepID=A0A7Y6ILF7_9ACTN|nr:M15 family metallopeptidase [Nonomuraea rhodomycinica]NUW40432.1 M15 family metallopeptidase [Nonomuraea rhodomycinica]